MAKIRGGASLAKLRGRKKALETDVDYEELLQELNPEDHPVRHATSDAEIKRSKERVKKKEAQIRAINRQIAKRASVSKGGGGGQTGLVRGRSRSLLQMAKDMRGPLNE